MSFTRLFQSHASETSQVQHYMSKNFKSQLKKLSKNIYWTLRRCEI